MVAIVARGDWGARQATSFQLQSPAGKSLTIHWLGQDDDASVDGAAEMRAIQAAHMDSGEYADVAYNFGVGLDGVIYEGRGWDRRSGANGTSAGNDSSIAVVVLNGTGQPVTETQKRAVGALRSALVRRGGTTEVFGHQDWTPTECPGDVIYQFVGELAASAPDDEDGDMVDYERIQSMIGQAINDLSERNHARHQAAASLTNSAILAVSSHHGWTVEMAANVVARLAAIEAKMVPVADLSSVPTDQLLAELGRRL